MKSTNQAPVVQTLDSAIHWINLYPLDNSISFASVYLLDSDLSGGQRYPSFEQLGPEVQVGEDILNYTDYYFREGIWINKKPQKRINNNRKSQNRNEFRSKPKTAGKIREDMHEVEVVEVHISEEKPEQHQTALNATDAKTRFYFCRKPKTESGIEQELQTAIVTKKPTNRSLLVQRSKNRF